MTAQPLAFKSQRIALLDYVFHIERWRMISVRPCRGSFSDRANFFHGLLRPDVLFPDIEHDVLNKLECVIQQQSFHLCVVPSAPILSR